MLVVIGGLPATGKTTLARLLAQETGAVHVRVDTIEQALVRSGLARHSVGPAGYVVGYALAEEHLRQGPGVIAESVNPLAVTRDAWRDTAARAGIPWAEVEVICSDPAEHRRRVTSRSVDIPDLPLPDWAFYSPSGKFARSTPAPMAPPSPPTAPGLPAMVSAVKRTRGS